MKTYETRSKLISKLTLRDFDLYRGHLSEYTDESVQMYIDRFVHKKTLEAIGESRGYSKEMVRRRINQLIGNINSFREGKYENRSSSPT